MLVIRLFTPVVLPRRRGRGRRRLRRRQVSTTRVLDQPAALSEVPTPRSVRGRSHIHGDAGVQHQGRPIVGQGSNRCDRRKDRHAPKSRFAHPPSDDARAPQSRTHSLCPVCQAHTTWPRMAPTSSEARLPTLVSATSRLEPNRIPGPGPRTPLVFATQYSGTDGNSRVGKHSIGYIQDLYLLRHLRCNPKRTEGFRSAPNREILTVQASVR